MFLLLISLLSIVKLWAYNVDVDNAKIFHYPKDNNENVRKNYFGFSVALYVDENFLENSLILVGAPRANVSQIKTVIEPGSIFKCSIQSNESCKEWILDSTEDGDIKFRSLTAVQLRDNAWTGATIAVKSGINPTVVVCAPRWKARIRRRSNQYDWFLNGICYRTRANDSNFFETEINSLFESKISPFYYYRQVKMVDGRYQYFFAMGQAGFSLHMVPDSEDLILGSPGIFNWTGVPLLVQVEERVPTREEIIYKNIKSFSVKYNNVYDTIEAIQEEPSIHYNEYFGYSVSSGCYFQIEQRWYSSGIPRGDNLNGRVLIFSHPNRSTKQDFIIKNTLNGEQHGEYFGYTLASCDLNNDKKDDLVVGAPLWSNNLEEGRVYVFSSKGNDNDYLEAQYIHGEAIKGRFGSTLACIGDIDYDNYGDIAIGAPYENNCGAIFIYRGTENGLQLSQKIFASEISSHLQGFGNSISDARDIDSNGYPDIAVGAYLSDAVVLLRTKPIVTLKITKMKALLRTKLQASSSFFDIEVCFHYSGKHVPNKLNVTLKWKIDEIFGRARLSPEANNATIYELERTLIEDTQLCDNFKIYLNTKIQEFMNPLEIWLTLNLNSMKLNSTTRKTDNSTIVKDEFCKTCPVVNKEFSIIEKSLLLPFAVECGYDDICTSNLTITMFTDLTINHFILGSRKTFSLFINIVNDGEPAYKSEIRIIIPRPLQLANIPPDCSENEIDMTCNVGNPLRKNKTIELQLSTIGVTCNSTSSELEVMIFTQSENSNENNHFKIVIHFAIDLDMLLLGKAQEDSYSYTEEETIMKIKKFTHIYEIQKFGSCSIDEIEALIKIPILLKDGNNNFPIIEIQQIKGRIDDREILCTQLNNEDLIPKENHSSLMSTNIEKLMKNEIFKNFHHGENSFKYMPPENRTLYVNCSNSIISCLSFKCKLTGLLNSTSMKIVLNMEFQPKILQSMKLQEKDILFFITEGGVTVTKSEGFSNVIETKTNIVLVGTTFLGMPIKQKVATWILILSTLFGILLLIFVISILTKFGFFTRKRRQQLHALKADRRRKRKQKLPSSSSSQND